MKMLKKMMIAMVLVGSVVSSYATISGKVTWIQAYDSKDVNYGGDSKFLFGFYEPIYSSSDINHHCSKNTRPWFVADGQFLFGVIAMAQAKGLQVSVEYDLPSEAGGYCSVKHITTTQ